MSGKTVATRVLMVFVWVSIGFAWGTEAARRRGERVPAPAEAVRAAPAGDKVVVYYMHAKFRCMTCNRMEAWVKSVLEREFATALSEGRLEWQSVDFQTETDLAARYGVGASTVVLVRRFADGTEAAERLDEVWSVANDETGFARLVGGAVRDMLQGDWE